MGSPHGACEVLKIGAVDEYVCTLPVEVCMLAFRDLHESEDNRVSSLITLRQWVEEHQDIIKCRMDGNFLLRFLRLRKFQARAAREQLEKYLRLRVSLPTWFSALDVFDPRIEDLINRGYFFALPKRDESGRRVFFSIPSTLDVTKHTSDDVMRCMLLGYESLLEDEENQVRGFTYIFDEKNVGLHLLTLWTPSDVSKAFNTCEKTIPVRHKEIHIVNMNSSLLTIFELTKTFLSEKMRHRFQVHSNEEKLRSKVPADILPKEYGGLIPLADMLNMYKKELLSVRSKVALIDQIEILKKIKTNKFDLAINNIQKNFKKLDID